MKFPDAINVIARNQAIGNALFAAISQDPNPGTPFSGEFAMGLRVIDSNTGATAWGFTSLCRTSVTEAVAEFLQPAGPYPKLNALGINDATVAIAKAVVDVEAGPRAIYEYRLPAMLSENNYEQVMGAT